MIEIDIKLRVLYLIVWLRFDFYGFIISDNCREMVNVVDIVVPIVVAIIIVAVSIYLFSIYCHPEQKAFGNQIFPKILVILSQALAWGQILLLPLDLGVQGASDGSTFYLVYYILYPIIFALIAFLNPFAMFFYQSDDSDPMTRRVFWSALFAFIVAAIWSVFVFISYVWLGTYSIAGVEYRINAALYIFLALSLVGWVLLALNGAVGLVFLPFDLIAYFVNKPQPMTTQQAFAKKKKLQEESSNLITQGQKLRQQSQQLRQFEGGWFSRKRNQAKFQKLLQNYKQRINKLQEEYELFSNDLQRQSRHPVVYIVALLFGIISIVLSAFWFFQILGHVLRNSTKQPIYSFIDGWLAGLSSSGGSFFATLLYGAFVIYMQICLQKGNMVYGFRIPYLIKVHPMVVNKTYMNSLLFNSNLMLLASCAISFQALWTFPQYFTPTACFLASFYQFQVMELPLFGTVYGKRIPLTVMEVLTVVVLIFLIVRTVWRYCREKKSDAKVEGKASI